MIRKQMPADGSRAMPEISRPSCRAVNQRGRARGHRTIAGDTKRAHADRFGPLVIVESKIHGCASMFRTRTRRFKFVLVPRRPSVALVILTRFRRIERTIGSERLVSQIYTHQPRCRRAQRYRKPTLLREPVRYARISRWNGAGSASLQFANICRLSPGYRGVIG